MDRARSDSATEEGSLTDERAFFDAMGIAPDELDELLDLNEVPADKRHNLILLRGSESCARKSWFLNNLYGKELEAVAAASPEVPEWSADNLRLEVGNLLEDTAIEAARRKRNWLWVRHQQARVSYYSQQWNTLLIGHIDGMVNDGGLIMLLEVKTTSAERFDEVKAAMLDPMVQSEMLDKYKAQMRRYLAMIHVGNAGMELDPKTIERTVGKLVVMNRNSCEVAAYTVPLFEDESGVQGFLDGEIDWMLGGVVTRGGRPPTVPLGFYRTHPICKTCMMWSECYAPARESITKVEVSRELEQLGEEYLAGDAMYKAGDAKRKRVRSQVLEVMKDLEESKLRLGEDVVASKSNRRGANRIDRDRMREDGVLDRYLVEGKPYEVVSLTVRR